MKTTISFSRLILPLSILVFLAFVIFIERSGISYRPSEYPASFLEASDSENGISVLNDPKTLVLFNSEGLAQQSYSTVSAVLESMKIPFDSHDIAMNAEFNPGLYNTLITAFIEFEKMNTRLAEIITWVNQGGKLLIAIRPDNTLVISEFQSQLGISEKENLLINSNGVEFLSPILPGVANRKFGLDFMRHTSLPVSLNPESIIHIISADGSNVPILWETDFGQGKIVFVNTDQFIGKDSRGVISAAYSLLQDVVIYPVINSSVFFIDDFPAPVPEGFDEIIFRQFNRDIEGFYLNIWWPDMDEIRSKYKLKFSTVAIENYNYQTSPPFNYNSGQQDIFQFFGGFVLRNSGEIGYHGFNHIPFCKEKDQVNQILDYPSWESARNMQSSILELNRFLRSMFPEQQLYVYVPVSNILCSEARGWLPNILPNLRIIASVYLPDAEVPAYVQEFSEAEDGMIEFPRITSGYFPDNYMEWATVNELGLHFVFGHFIHPDDVLDSVRSQGKLWTDMRETLDEFLLWVYSSAPGIRNLTASEGAMAVQRFVRVSPQYECDQKECRLTLDGFVDDAWFLMRTEHTPATIVNGAISPVTEGLYLVEAKARNILIGFEE